MSFPWVMIDFLHHIALGFISVLALLTVLDGKKGEVEVIFDDHAEGVVAGIIEDMERFQIMLREVSDV